MEEQERQKRKVTSISYEGMIGFYDRYRFKNAWKGMVVILLLIIAVTKAPVLWSMINNDHKYLVEQHYKLIDYLDDEFGMAYGGTAIEELSLEQKLEVLNIEYLTNASLMQLSGKICLFTFDDYEGNNEKILYKMKFLNEYSAELQNLNEWQEPFKEIKEKEYSDITEMTNEEKTTYIRYMTHMLSISKLQRRLDNNDMTYMVEAAGKSALVTMMNITLIGIIILATISEINHKRYIRKFEAC